MATSQLHIDQVRENIRSENPRDEEDPEETAINKTLDTTNLAFTRKEVMVTPENLYRYQTGHFPVKSKKGIKYLFVLYFYDANEIITETFKDRTGK